MATQTRREVADLVVVGGSVGGLLAAIDAADRGGRVVIVEAEKTLGGSAPGEPEHVAVAGSDAQRAAGIADTPADLVADLLAETHHHIQQPVAQAIADAGPAVIEWIAERLRIRAVLVPGSRYREHSRARVHVLGEPGGRVLVEALTAAVSRHHRIRVLTGIPASRLVVTDGRVTGVELASRRRSDPVAADGPVLLACGGYAGDDELVRAEAPEAADLPALGAELATGAGLRLARQAGARVESLGAILVTGLLALPSRVALDPVLLSLGGILVNQQGRRFIDETAEQPQVARAVHGQPGHLAYLLFDQRIAREAGEASAFLARVAIPRSARRADRLADLAKQLEIDEETLGRTVDTFNANVELGGDPFDRAAPPASLTAPFHAARVTAARRRALGGVAIDPGARVLTDAGTSLPGLYAAGGVVGGLGRGGPADELPGMATLIALASAHLAVASWSDDRAAARTTDAAPVSPETPTDGAA